MLFGWISKVIDDDEIAFKSMFTLLRSYHVDCRMWFTQVRSMKERMLAFMYSGQKLFVQRKMQNAKCQ